MLLMIDVAVMMATEDFYEEARARDDVPPVYRFPEPAARSLAQLARYAAWRRQPEESAVEPFDVDDEAVAALVAEAGQGDLTPEAALQVLELYGIPTAAGHQVRNAPEAISAAAKLGYPVVIKAVAPSLIHKSDVGAVRVDVRNADELATAVHEIEASVEAAGHDQSARRLIERPLQLVLQAAHEHVVVVPEPPAQPSDAQNIERLIAPLGPDGVQETPLEALRDSGG